MNPAKQLADMSVDKSEISTCDSQPAKHFSRHNHFNRYKRRSKFLYCVRRGRSLCKSKRIV